MILMLEEDNPSLFQNKYNSIGRRTGGIDRLFFVEDGKKSRLLNLYQVGGPRRGPRGRVKWGKKSKGRGAAKNEGDFTNPTSPTRRTMKKEKRIDRKANLTPERQIRTLSKRD